MKVNVEELIRAFSKPIKTEKIELTKVINATMSRLAYDMNTGNFTEYNVGYYNALEFIYSILDDTEPQYIDVNNVKRMTQETDTHIIVFTAREAEEDL